ncbi:hypothetical protein PsorP6_001056 [Peronosclerospora sorghi]|uniref:Uncharacterized protein n=1 Tax=Peronosclerospora sorghi TaxID=230839 RepID=A0ACC0WRE8_9STRA|nr:hypothetical protein PsorP6_001056 [Peronosclerospora sorghi]
MVMSIVVTIRHRIVAFEAPLHERRALREAKRAVLLHRRYCERNDVKFTSYGSVAIQDAELFQFVSFLLSSERFTMFTDKRVQLFMLSVIRWSKENVQVSDRSMTFTRWEDAFARYLMAETEERPRSGVLVLITYRPKMLLPLCMASARRAFKFVNAVVALVTANAYVSTLGGGHFLCRHVNQSTLLAKLQIAISMGLHDPILESKCRVNLMYNALQLGKFKRARKILRREEVVAKQLESHELRNVCHAAKVYLDKMARVLTVEDLTTFKR